MFRLIRRVFRDGVHLDGKRRIPIHTNQYFSFFETFGIGFYLFRGHCRQLKAAIVKVPNMTVK